MRVYLAVKIENDKSKNLQPMEEEFMLPFLKFLQFGLNSNRISNVDFKVSSLNVLKILLSTILYPAEKEYMLRLIIISLPFMELKLSKIH